MDIDTYILRFQSPRGDFGFLKFLSAVGSANYLLLTFQSPRGDFGFLKCATRCAAVSGASGFNPLAGILVF